MGRKRSIDDSVAIVSNILTFSMHQLSTMRHPFVAETTGVDRGPHQVEREPVGQGPIR